MKMILAVAAGGGLGAVARYLTGVGLGHWLGTAYPWATMTVNVTGSFAMGVLAGLGAHVWQPAPELRAFLMVGVLGGFTTFSSFSLDVALLVERGAIGAAAAYVAASFLLSVGGLFAGLALIRTAVA
ncbi:fluoride efflux transporter CrcB [Rhodospirillum centenum]|uniref:Fluoride-specific ion channel FluC n=1 Tax=Rhodospirillum centenum (strain ATCC 51521 / SW) TaxID=414684 RepID=FLUC_RHOCS|nr:fluoride efflux transporter CrcB [Rhodospirillum centenum]B6IQX6.1 RecName: Full=Fluoride-specific ion channel FluC [Rhodospirillum centenum SW]ACI97862.1 CrcB-like protein [Rhodospirillum centenum SW]